MNNKEILLLDPYTSAWPMGGGLLGDATSTYGYQRYTGDGEGYMVRGTLGIFVEFDITFRYAHQEKRILRSWRRI